jgi:dTDP-4-dehydrorhamnose 3,5-epimerase
MIIRKTEFPGLLIIEPKVFEDERGYFFESYHQKKLSEEIPYRFVQENESKSGKGVIRGLHYQLNPYAQAKLLRVVQGKIYDVAVDLRKGSPAFGKWFGMEISDENKLQILIPRGFAHGFSVLSETATVFYKCSEFYHQESERGIYSFDPDLKIDWKISEKDALLSERDKKLPPLRKADSSFFF